jgi:hypothetical protein
MAQKSPAAAKHEQQSLYRLGAGATLFEARDPDPNAVDGGRVLGIRFDVCVEGPFTSSLQFSPVLPVLFASFSSRWALTLHPAVSLPLSAFSIPH